MSEQERKPAPDPTVLTTEQLLREVTNAVGLLEAQLTGMKDVMAEKFASVETQFGLIERQRVEQKTDTATAVAAALSAAKEAVAEQTAASEKSILKSEDATTSQLQQLNNTFTTAIGSVVSSFDDLKERVGKIESRKEGSDESRGRHDITFGQIIAVVGLIVTVVLAVATIAALGGAFK